MRLSKTLGFVSVLALVLMGAVAVAEDDHGRSDDFHFGRDRDHDNDHDHGGFHGVRTATPIKHVVVIFQENISFDHYFGTYPHAENRQGETPFYAKPFTPVVNGLKTPLDVNRGFSPLKGVDLLNKNPNSISTNPVAPNNNVQNGAGASNPFRLAPAQALTADQGHNEQPEQAAYNNGHMDGFPAFVGVAGPPPAGIGTKALVMGYYDGNTVTALWNYAQNFAMSDNSYSTQFGPSTPGALNLISGQTSGLANSVNVINGSGVLLHPTHEAFGDAAHTASNITEIGDGDPIGDVCSNPAIDQITMSGRNIGDILNDKGISWGCFMGGFDLDVTNANGTTGCAAQTTNPTVPGTPAHLDRLHPAPRVVPVLRVDRQSAQHLRPSSLQAIGHSLDARQRDAGAGQSPVRQQRLLCGAQGRQSAGGQLPEGPGLPGRSRRLFEPARRADLRRQRHQCPAGEPGMGRYGRHRRLRRLRRLVRSPDAADRQSVGQFGARRAQRSGPSATPATACSRAARPGQALNGSLRPAGLGTLRLRHAHAAARWSRPSPSATSSTTR